VLHILSYSALTLPIFVREFFAAFGFANLAFLPNFFSPTISEDGDAPSPFEEEDMSNNFLLNCGQFVTAWFILCGVAAIACLSSWIIP
jgi:hypothetical protein